MPTPSRSLLLPALALVLGACADRQADAAGRASADSARRAGVAAAAAPGSREALPAIAAAALDRANAEFRAGRYATALVGYRAAAMHAPSHAAPYYGVYMVARQLGDAALADSAMAAIRARTPAAATLGDSAVAAVHGGATATGGTAGATATGALPTGHPPVQPRALPPGHPPTGTKKRAAPAPPAPRAGT